MKTTPENRSGRRSRRARRSSATAVLAITTIVLSSCTVLGPYPNHGYFACFLQVGPDVPPNLVPPLAVFPIAGELLWEVCVNAD